MKTNPHTVKLGEFANVKVGDKLTRMLAGTIAVEVIVLRVEKDAFYVGNPEINRWEEGWKFDKEYGCEIDERFNSGPPLKYPATISFIKR